MYRVAIVMVLAACGREGFIPGGPDAQFFDARPSTADAADPGLLLHYTFDDPDVMTEDTGALHDNGVCTGPCPLQIVGRVGAGAASIAGTSCLQITDELALRATAFSAALWVNIGPGNSTTVIFERPYMNGNGGSNTFLISYENGSQVVFGNVNNLGQELGIGAMWHHVAITFDGGSIITYLDGVGTSPIGAGAAMYGNDSLVIGCGVVNGIMESFFVGYLDDIRFYNRALSASEVAALAAM